MLKPRPDIQNFSRILFTAQSLLLVGHNTLCCVQSICGIGWSFTTLFCCLCFFWVISIKVDSSEVYSSDGNKVASIFVELLTVFQSIKKGNFHLGNKREYRLFLSSTAVMENPSVEWNFNDIFPSKSCPTNWKLLTIQHFTFSVNSITWKTCTPKVEWTITSLSMIYSTQSIRLPAFSSPTQFTVIFDRELIA